MNCGPLCFYAVVVVGLASSAMHSLPNSFMVDYFQNGYPCFALISFFPGKLFESLVSVTEINLVFPRFFFVPIYEELQKC